MQRRKRFQEVEEKSQSAGPCPDMGTKVCSCTKQLGTPSICVGETQLAKFAPGQQVSSLSLAQSWLLC